MKQIMEFFKSGIGVLITVVFIGIIVGFFVFIKPMFDDSKEDMVGQTAVITGGKYDAYDDKLVGGAEVIAAATKFKTEAQFSVLVKTGSSTAGFYAENNSAATPVLYAAPSTAGTTLPDSAAGTGTTVKISQMKDKSDPLHYVNPSAQFDANIFRTADGEVRLIVFKQR